MNPQSGGMNMATPGKSTSKILIIIVLVLLLIGSVCFGVWAYSGQTKYKNDTSQAVATAVAAAKTSEKNSLQQTFASQLKQPYDTFTSLSTLGSITFSYPKTYSAYVDQTNPDEPIDGYFYPGQVPGISSNTAFALRVELVTDTYSDVLTQETSQSSAGTVNVAAYVPSKMVGVKNVQTGSLLTGDIAQDSQGNPLTGAMLIIPVRDQTLEIYTESSDFLSDFNNIILPSLTFSP